MKGSKIVFIFAIAAVLAFSYQEASAESILYGIGFPRDQRVGGAGDSTLYTIDITNGVSTVVGTITGFGFCDGLVDGIFVGLMDGLMDGLIDGIIDGLIDGMIVGWMVIDVGVYDGRDGL